MNVINCFFRYKVYSSGEKVVEWKYFCKNSYQLKRNSELKFFINTTISSGII